MLRTRLPNPYFGSSVVPPPNSHLLSTFVKRHLCLHLPTCHHPWFYFSQCRATASIIFWITALRGPMGWLGQWADCLHGPVRWVSALLPLLNNDLGVNFIGFHKGHDRWQSGPIARYNVDVIILHFNPVQLPQWFVDGFSGNFNRPDRFNRMNACMV